MNYINACRMTVRNGIPKKYAGRIANPALLDADYADFWLAFDEKGAKLARQIIQKSGRSIEAGRYDFPGMVHLFEHEVPDPPRATIAAEVSATNFLAYRRAVQMYLQANPSATGTIADGSLSSYWLQGYIRNANWTNTVSGNSLYVYSTAAVTANTLDALHRMAPENELLGSKDPSTGNLKSYNGTNTGVALPGGIPNSAIVMMGR